MIEDRLVGQREERAVGVGQRAVERVGLRRAPAAAAGARTRPSPGVDVVPSCEQRSEQDDLRLDRGRGVDVPLLGILRRATDRRHGVAARRAATRRRQRCRFGGVQALTKLRDLGGEHGVVLQRMDDWAWDDPAELRIRRDGFEESAEPRRRHRHVAGRHR